jgi:lysophospholipase L1-like esterase
VEEISARNRPYLCSVGGIPLSRSLFIRSLGYLVIISLLYVSSMPIAYVFSSFLLTKGVILRFGILRDFQKDFYVNGGYRNIWQLQKECITVDDTLIYAPKVGRCRFANPEFDTTLTFDGAGRFRKRLSGTDDSLGIAVLGDSQAMGWGVNDPETFANMLQDGLRKPVYNLGVSSYGTVRELMRFERSALPDKVDTVLIQYSENDLMENDAVDQGNKISEARTMFEQAVNSDGRSSRSAVPQSVKRALSFALEKPIRNLRDMFELSPRRYRTFAPHYQGLIRVLRRFASTLDQKRIVIFSIDEVSFDDFPNGRDPAIKNLEFVDISLDTSDFYPIDGHLNSNGHARVGRLLTRYLLEPLNGRSVH